MPDELDLVERMRRGDQRAFDEFFDKYAERLAAFASRRCSLDSAALEDVVQVSMINAVRGLAGFRGESALFTWLCQICRNHLADIARKLARQPKVKSLDALLESHEPATVIELTDFRDPLEECADDSSRHAVRRAINRLPASYARILELRFGDELSVPEIARVLQLTEDAAESRLARARQAFRKEWSPASAGATGESA